MNYACGFVFDEEFKRVVLTQHPKFGRLNGVGGKSHPDERRARDTMARECREEIGLDVNPEAWVLFAEYIAPKTKNRVLFFYTRLSNLNNLGYYDVGEVVNGSHGTMPDVPWLVALARTWREQQLDCVVMMAERKASEDSWRSKI